MVVIRKNGKEENKFLHDYSDDPVSNFRKFYGVVSDKGMDNRICTAKPPTSITIIGLSILNAM